MDSVNFVRIIRTKLIIFIEHLMEFQKSKTNQIHYRNFVNYHLILNRFPYYLY